MIAEPLLCIYNIIIQKANKKYIILIDIFSVIKITLYNCIYISILIVSIFVFPIAISENCIGNDWKW